MFSTGFNDPGGLNTAKRYIPGLFCFITIVYLFACGPVFGTSPDFKTCIQPGRKLLVLPITVQRSGSLDVADRQALRDIAKTLDARFSEQLPAGITSFGFELLQSADLKKQEKKLGIRGYYNPHTGKFDQEKFKSVLKSLNVDAYIDIHFKTEVFVRDSEGSFGRKHSSERQETLMLEVRFLSAESGDTCDIFHGYTERAAEVYRKALFPHCDDSVGVISYFCREIAAFSSKPIPVIIRDEKDDFVDAADKLGTALKELLLADRSEDVSDQ